MYENSENGPVSSSGEKSCHSAYNVDPQHVKYEKGTQKRRKNKIKPEKPMLSLGYYRHGVARFSPKSPSLGCAEKCLGLLTKFGMILLGEHLLFIIKMERNSCY